MQPISIAPSQVDRINCDLHRDITDQITPSYSGGIILPKFSKLQMLVGEF
jgi:hypothetical protein